MQQSPQGHWRIISPPHEWLKKIEGQLSDLINSKQSSQ